MTTSEKVAYLKGLMDGLGLDAESKEGRIFTCIADILEDIALDMEDLEENALDLGEEIDALSDDLATIEDYFTDDYDEDEDDYDSEDDYYTGGCGKGCCGGGNADEPLFFEVTCPSCDKTITVDEDVLDLGTIQCPSCGEMLEFDLDEDEDDDEDEGDGEE